MAKRIRARATRRAGELLKQIPPAANHHAKSSGGGAPTTRKSAATEAGLSRRQAIDAKRLANIPEDQFEQMVEDGETVTAMARVGTQ